MGIVYVTDANSLYIMFRLFLFYTNFTCYYLAILQGEA